MAPRNDPGGRRKRPTVALVTTYWGEAPTEAIGATRLIAGALARRADVAVVELSDSPTERYEDGVFDVHRFEVGGADQPREALLREALRRRNGSGRIPQAALELLSAYGGEAIGVAEALRRIDPASVVLVGSRQPWELGALGAGGRRVVAIPFCSDGPQFPAEIARLCSVASRLGTIHPGEQAALSAAAPGRGDDVVDLPIAFGTNAQARSEPLAGIGRVGEYVLLVRSFPAGGPRHARTVNGEVLHTILERPAVVEVDGNGWWVCDDNGVGPLLVNRNRVNFSRLVAHALATVDIRPQGPVGRVAVESMLYGVPAVVPDDSAAKAHVAAASGGLWYRDAGELFDETRALVETPLGGLLAGRAERYAQTTHGDIEAFVARMGDFALGEGARPY